MKIGSIKLTNSLFGQKIFSSIEKEGTGIDLSYATGTYKPATATDSSLEVTHNLNSVNVVGFLFPETDFKADSTDNSEVLMIFGGRYNPQNVSIEDSQSNDISHYDNIMGVLGTSQSAPHSSLLHSSQDNDNMSVNKLTFQKPATYNWSTTTTYRWIVIDIGEIL